MFSLYHNLVSLRRSATVGNCILRGSIVGEVVVSESLGADISISCDKSAIVLLLGRKGIVLGKCDCG